MGEIELLKVYLADENEELITTQRNKDFILVRTERKDMGRDDSYSYILKSLASGKYYRATDEWDDGYVVREVTRRTRTVVEYD